MSKFVIVGASSAGIKSVLALRVADPQAQIMLISEENFLPYDRKELAKFISGDISLEELYFFNESYYEQNNLELILDKKVISINALKQTVAFKIKGSLEYDHLIVATGRRFDFGDLPGAKKNGVFNFYYLKEILAFQKFLINQPVCLVGADSLALAVSGAIAAKFKVEVKLISANNLSDCPLPAGVELVIGELAEIIGEGQVQAIKLKSGKAFGVCAVVGMGNLSPNSELFKGSSAVLEQGLVVVDKQMQVSINNVMACGSVVFGSLDEKDDVKKIMDGLFKKKEAPGMSVETLINLGVQGSQKLLALCSQSLNTMIAQKGGATKISFPETNYYLPLINALLNIEVKDLNDCLLAFGQAENLAKQEPAASGLIINSLGGIFNQGLASLICEEILAALAVASGQHPQGGIGFIPDTILRSLGLQLVDGRISGIAVILGPAKDDQAALDLIRDFQSKSIVCLLAGNVDGKTFRTQLENKAVALGLENYIVPLGDDYLSAIYALNFAIRAPLIYGGNKPGQWLGIADYIRNRVSAFVLLLGHADEIIATTGFGVLAFGIPIITDLDLPPLGKIDTTLFEALVVEKDYRKIPEKCVLTRGIKVKMSEVKIPVPYAAAFEGERVRREQLAVEFGGKASKAFEFLSLEDEAVVEDGMIELIGPDIDALPVGTKSLPLAIVVEVFGRKMQKDFEPILERQIHRFINYAMGLMHMGQRDMVWIRISLDAFTQGFRIKHLGTIIHAMLHQEYNAIVDKVQVKFFTRQEDIQRLLAKAQEAYAQRDQRLGDMTDESVDTFYSCLLCQSFAPNHICIVTPERLGLCGAYSWLDAKASFEITPTGPNQPILKGNLLDARLGQWGSVNEFVQQKSNQTISSVSMYSLMDGPQSSCGCFECIVAIVPEANGVMVVNRDYVGITPSGMSFTTLAGSVGGGVQTPGFLGVGKQYILSKKFISADGGLKRVVWMPKELKELLGSRLKVLAQEIGEPDLCDKIADESVATSSEELVVFLNKVAHPALKMEPMF